MYSNFPGRGRNGLSNWWSSLTLYQKIIVIVVGLLILYWIRIGSGGMFNPGRLLAVATIIFIAFPVHEFAHAATAVALGDDTPRWQGRYTLNPMAHIDPMGAILVLFANFGWARPVQWNPSRINIDQRLGTILVAIAGPFSNLLLAFVGALVVRFVSDVGFMFDFLYSFIGINVALFVFNLIPVPPLDGSHILFALLPGDTYQLRTQLSQYGFLILFAVIFLARGIIGIPTSLVLHLLEPVCGGCHLTFF